MEVIDLSDHNCILDIKQNIENSLKENGKLEQPMSLHEFINFLNLQNTIFIKDDTVIPFRIYENFIFTVVVDSNTDILIQTLENIDYNLSVLQTLENKSVFAGELDKYPYYFIINSEYKVIPKK